MTWFFTEGISRITILLLILLQKGTSLRRILITAFPASARAIFIDEEVELLPDINLTDESKLVATEIVERCIVIDHTIERNNLNDNVSLMKQVTIIFWK